MMKFFTQLFLTILLCSTAHTGFLTAAGVPKGFELPKGAGNALKVYAAGAGSMLLEYFADARPAEDENDAPPAVNKDDFLLDMPVRSALDDYSPPKHYDMFTDNLGSADAPLEFTDNGIVTHLDLERRPLLPPEEAATAPAKAQAIADAATLDREPEVASTRSGGKKIPNLRARTSAAADAASSDDSDEEGGATKIFGGNCNEKTASPKRSKITDSDPKRARIVKNAQSHFTPNSVDSSDPDYAEETTSSSDASDTSNSKMRKKPKAASTRSAKKAAPASARTFVRFECLNRNCTKCFSNLIEFEEHQKNNPTCSKITAVLLTDLSSDQAKVCKLCNKKIQDITEHFLYTHSKELHAIKQKALTIAATLDRKPESTSVTSQEDLDNSDQEESRPAVVKKAKRSYKCINPLCSHTSHFKKYHSDIFKTNVRASSATQSKSSKYTAHIEKAKADQHPTRKAAIKKRRQHSKNIKCLLCQEKFESTLELAWHENDPQRTCLNAATKIQLPTSSPVALAQNTEKQGAQVKTRQVMATIHQTATPEITKPTELDNAISTELSLACERGDSPEVLPISTTIRIASTSEATAEKPVRTNTKKRMLENDYEPASDSPKHLENSDDFEPKEPSAAKRPRVMKETELSPVAVAQTTKTESQPTTDMPIVDKESEHASDASITKPTEPATNALSATETALHKQEADTQNIVTSGSHTQQTSTSIELPVAKSASSLIDDQPLAILAAHAQEAPDTPALDMNVSHACIPRDANDYLTTPKFLYCPHGGCPAIFVSRHMLEEHCVNCRYKKQDVPTAIRTKIPIQKHKSFEKIYSWPSEPVTVASSAAQSHVWDAAANKQTEKVARHASEQSADDLQPNEAQQQDLEDHTENACGSLEHITTSETQTHDLEPILKSAEQQDRPPAAPAHAEVQATQERATFSLQQTINSAPNSATVSTGQQEVDTQSIITSSSDNQPSSATELSSPNGSGFVKDLQPTVNGLSDIKAAEALVLLASGSPANDVGKSSRIVKKIGRFEPSREMTDAVKKKATITIDTTPTVIDKQQDLLTNTHAQPSVIAAATAPSKQKRERVKIKNQSGNRLAARKALFDSTPHKSTEQENPAMLFVTVDSQENGPLKALDKTSAKSYEQEKATSSTRAPETETSSARLTTVAQPPAATAATTLIINSKEAAARKPSSRPTFKCILCFKSFDSKNDRDWHEKDPRESCFKIIKKYIDMPNYRCLLCKKINMSSATSFRQHCKTIMHQELLNKALQSENSCETLSTARSKQKHERAFTPAAIKALFNSMPHRKDSDVPFFSLDLEETHCLKALDKAAPKDYEQGKVTKSTRAPVTKATLHQQAADARDLVTISSDNEPSSVAATPAIHGARITKDAQTPAAAVTDDQEARPEGLVTTSHLMPASTTKKHTHGSVETSEPKRPRATDAQPPTTAALPRASIAIRANEFAIEHHLLVRIVQSLSNSFIGENSNFCTMCGDYVDDTFYHFSTSHRSMVEASIAKFKEALLEQDSHGAAEVQPPVAAAEQIRTSAAKQARTQIPPEPAINSSECTTLPMAVVPGIRTSNLLLNPSDAHSSESTLTSQPQDAHTLTDTQSLSVTETSLDQQKADTHDFVISSSDNQLSTDTELSLAECTGSAPDDQSFAVKESTTHILRAPVNTANPAYRTCIASSAAIESTPAAGHVASTSPTKKHRLGDDGDISTSAAKRARLTQEHHVAATEVRPDMEKHISDKEPKTASTPSPISTAAALARSRLTVTIVAAKKSCTCMACGKTFVNQVDRDRHEKNPGHNCSKIIRKHVDVSKKACLACTTGEFSTLDGLREHCKDKGHKKRLHDILNDDANSTATEYLLGITRLIAFVKSM